MQSQLKKHGKLNIQETPFKDFDSDVSDTVNLLKRHQFVYPYCTVSKEEWDDSVSELEKNFEELPKLIVNSMYTPNILATRSPFQPRENIRRNLFNSPMVQVINRFHS